MTSIVVVGSLSMDFVVGVDRLPAAGETVLGRDFQMVPGGKGQNQAFVAAKLGGNSVQVKMVGRVGHDTFGDQVKANLAAAGVDVSALNSARSHPTGIALIWVETSGQNAIVVAPGANHALLAAEVEAMRPVLRGARYVLFQLESPLDTVAAALKLARAEGAKTILDPAPAQPLAGELLADVDVLTPNESEALLLVGRAPGRIAMSDAPELARALLARGPRAVVLKLGDQGCFYCAQDHELVCCGFAVNAVDATAAGDTFNAALAVALAEDRPLPDALRFANAAAAISVTRIGATSSAPSRMETDAFLAASAA